MWSVSYLLHRVSANAILASQTHLAFCRRRRVALLFTALVVALTFCPSSRLEAGITNGDFEANSYTYSPIGWTASGVFITPHVSVEKPGYIAEVSNGTNFADFNVDTPRVLTGNTLSQTAEADGSYLAFSWNRLRNSYLGNGGVTLQVAYQDITESGSLITQNIDFAPDGDEVFGTQPWRQEFLPGFMVGHSYFIEFRGGSSIGVTPNDSYGVYYMIDNVAFSTVPEPSTIALLTTAGASLLFMAWRRRKRS